jgi:hypothetical protein
MAGATLHCGDRYDTPMRILMRSRLFGLNGPRLQAKDTPNGMETVVYAMLHLLHR